MLLAGLPWLAATAWTLSPVLAGAGILGCGAPAPSDEFLYAMAAGTRALNAGRYSDAEKSYVEAEKLATRVKDRDEAIFMQARMRELVEDWPAAQERYRHLVAVSPTGPRSLRAIFEIAEIEIEHGNSERGWGALEAALVRYPNHGSARRAMSRVVRHIGRTRGEEAARAFLSRNQPTFSGTEAEQQARYELAQSWERSGELERARDEYISLAKAYPYPYGNLTDDSYWRAALIEEKLGRYHEAIALLRVMVEIKEWDPTGSSYERPRFPYAQMRIARIYRDKLGDVANARRELHRMYERHAESAGTDDALWQEALLARGAGDPDDACSIMRLIRDEYPHSRYMRCANRMCETVSVVDPDRRGCPPYIARTLTGEPDLSLDELDTQGDDGGEPEEGAEEIPLGAAVKAE